MRLRVNWFAEEIESEFLKKIGNRKLVCWGADKDRYTVLNTIIYMHDLIDFFVDIDSGKWGKILSGREIKSPAVIDSLDMEQYAVVVLARDFYGISKILDRKGMKKGVDYFDIAQYRWLRQVGVDFNSLNKLLTFLEKVPPEIGNVVANKGDEKIGIVMSVEGLNYWISQVPYNVVLYLILKYKGYNVKLIVDCLSWDGDIVVYEGYCAHCRKIIDMVLRCLYKIVPRSDIMLLDYCESGIITAEDEKECKKVAEYSALWSKWLIDERIRYIPHEILEEELFEIYKRNIVYLDKFFEENLFGTINVSTGLHKAGGLYSYIGRKRNIRVSSQDGYNGQTLLSSNGPASYRRDVKRIFHENLLTEEEKKHVQKKAGEMWAKRRSVSITKDLGNNLDDLNNKFREKGLLYVTLQSPEETNNLAYDVVIPLNLMCDGAALGVQSIFESKEQWLAETLDFVINELGKSVLLREHPSGRAFLKNYPCTELYAVNPEILEPYKENQLLRYAKSDEDLNLYQYIEQCKVVIPWTSSVGLEAGVMKKNVLVHTDVFYDNTSWVLQARSRNEYFELLRKCILEDKWLVQNEEQAHQEALGYFYYGMQANLITEFNYMCSNLNEHSWLNMDFSELLEAEGVEEIIQVVAENVPSFYLIAKQYERIYEN